MSDTNDSIETERLVLEPWSDAAHDVFTRLARDPEVTRYLGDEGRPWDDDKIEKVFRREADHWVEHGFGWRAALDKESGDRIGFVGLNHVPEDAVEIPGENEVEIGWWLVPGYWGRGLATEGAVALRDEAFGRVGLARIIGRFQPPNIASGRIMERIGMAFEVDVTGRHNETVRIYALERQRWSSLVSDGGS